jgi:H+/Cl- antiporter ClcA
MEVLNLTDKDVVAFVIPGFLLVWVFRCCTRSERRGDFEFLGLSFVWGLILAIVTSYLVRHNPNPSIRALAASGDNQWLLLLVMGLIVAPIAGWFGAVLHNLLPITKIVSLISFRGWKE